MECNENTAENIEDQVKRVPYLKRTELPSESGVYFVFDGEKILYVGFSENIRNRWQSRRRLLETADPSRLEIGYVLLPPIEAIEAERQLIKKYKPPFNFVGQSDVRMQNISIRFTHHEVALIERAIGYSDRSRADFLRDALLSYSKDVLLKEWGKFFNEAFE